jgi:hypothetical protein
MAASGLVVIEQVEKSQSAQPTGIQTLEKYESSSMWLKSQGSPFTKQTYPHHLHRLLKFITAVQGKPINPDELAKMRKASVLGSVIPMTHTTILER